MGICAACGVAAAKACAACFSVHYCGRECQAADWRAHKPSCKRGALDFDCGACGAGLTSAAGSKCGSCARVAYCGKACQAAHWPAHKAACREATAARVFAGEGELEGGAEPQLRQALAKARGELGEDAEETVTAMAALARLLRRGSRNEEAVGLKRRIVAARKIEVQ
jgi:hypothetical protein